MSNNPELKFPLGKVKEVVHKWLYLEDDHMIDVMFATHIANQFQTDPSWMIFIAPPSHTKTELLRSFEGHPQAYFLSNLTPATLVSGINPKKLQEDPSLLLKLDGKTLILKDFTTVLSMRSENQQEIISQLREIYDGHYTKVFGNGKAVDWKGRVGLMAACTPVYDSHYAVIGTLGDRFLLYRTENSNDEEMGLQAQRIVGHEEEMRQEIKQAVHTFINQLDLKDIHFQKDEVINHMIVILGCFCAYARCPVQRDYRDQHIQYLPLPEGPARLVKQFMQIGMGLALVNGKTLIDVEIYEIIKKIGRDLIPGQRLKILKHLWDKKAFESWGEWLKTKEIAEAVSIPASTVKLILEDLMIVGLLNRQRGGEAENAPYKWQFSQKAYDRAAGAEVFKVTPDEPF